MNNDEFVDVPEEEPIKEISLFDMVGDISYYKSGILKTPITHGVDYDVSLIERYYSPDAMMMALAPHPNCIFQLQAVNYRRINPIIHHDYLFNTIPRQIRKGTWSKKTDIDKSVKVVAEYYNVSLRVAETYIVSKIVSSKDISNMEKELKSHKNFSC